jgi:hypothetical protein
MLRKILNCCTSSPCIKMQGMSERQSAIAALRSVSCFIAPSITINLSPELWKGSVQKCQTMSGKFSWSHYYELFPFSTKKYADSLKRKPSIPDGRCVNWSCMSAHLFASRLTLWLILLMVTTRDSKENSPFIKSSIYPDSQWISFEEKF